VGVALNFFSWVWTQQPVVDFSRPTFLAWEVANISKQATDNKKKPS